MTEIEFMTLPPQRTAAVRERVPIAELPEFFSRAFERVSTELRRQGVEPSGPPYGYYHGMPDAAVDVEAGYPVRTVVGAHDGVAPATLPGGEVAQAVHVGPFDTLAVTYAEVADAVQAAGRHPAEGMWESYLTDPAAEPDASTWRTRVTVPLT
jgi:effector-binding domain-containing protein